jgi:hypothetical protein
MKFRLAGPVTHVQRTMRERGNFEDLALEGRIILKYVSRWEGVE